VVTSLLVNPAMAKKPKYVIKMASVIPESDHIGKGYNKFAELVEKKSNGEIKVNVFHGGQLGSGKETFEAVRAGFLHIASDSYANLVTLTPAFEPFHLPYIFESRKQALTAFKNPAIRGHINKQLEAIGLSWIATLEFGPRQLFTVKKPINWPKDLKGLKLRASRSPLEIATHKQFGAASSTIDWPETFDALRMGMVDGYSVTFDACWSAKHYEVLKYAGALSFQVYGNVAVINKEWYDSLPQNVKDILTSAAREAETWHEAMLTDFINMNIREMKENGMKIYTYTDDQKAAFKSEALKVWKQFEKSTCPPEFIELIQREIGEPGNEGWGFKF